MDWKLRKTELAYDGWRKVDKLTFEMPNGTVADFEIKRSGKVVCVLALTPDNHVVLAKQFRPGPGRVLLDLPGGGCNPGEEPIEAMRRELLEETGYAGDMEFVGTSVGDAYSTLFRYNFIARNCKKTAEPENNPREPIEIVLMPLEEFRTKHLRSGELTDVTTGYLALDFAGLL